ncbi:MAG: phosphatidylglycerol lysyltransferase domain-containing protein [Bacteroidales bacterium]|nr:phosphatidylglycerol lysyltransferase domain-containing protein [Bacteroidales bacterium]
MNKRIVIDFKQVELSDKAWIDSLLRLSDYRGAEYCFTNLYVWRLVYRTRIARLQDWLLIRIGSPEHPTDIFPAGQGRLKALIDLLMDEALREGRDFKMAGIGAAQAADLQQLYPELFEMNPARDYWDYVYKVEDLSDLRGKHYQPKRNHIARFAEQPDWSYERLDAHNIPECVAMNREWCLQMGCIGNDSLGKEACAAETGLQHFDALQLEGGLLRLGGKVVAYTVGEPLNSDTYIVHVEKAFPDIRGAYQMINRAFVRDRMASFAHVNREDDAGDLGLRTAKTTYRPVFMQEKYFFTVPYTSLSHFVQKDEE